MQLVDVGLEHDDVIRDWVGGCRSRCQSVGRRNGGRGVCFGRKRRRKGRMRGIGRDRDQDQG